jgi:hypothetical protein
MTIRKNDQQAMNQTNDTAIKMVTIKIPRDQLPKIMKKYGITADKLVCYQHVGAPDVVKVGYTTGELPKGEVQFSMSMEDKPGMVIWDKVNDGLTFLTVFNQGRLVGMDFKDDVKWIGYLTRTNGQPAKFVDMVVPFKSLGQITQYVYLNGEPVWLNSPGKNGLTMVRVDRVNNRITALATDMYGNATKIVALDMDMVKNKPTLLENPEAWGTLIETKENMIFYSRAEQQDQNTVMIVRFQDGTSRRLDIDERKHTVQWNGLQNKVDHYVVGILPDHDYVVGYYAHPDSDQVELRFAPRTDQTIHTGFNIPS